MHPRLVSQAQKIRGVISLGESYMKKSETETASFLAKHACVMCSGFLENGVTITLEEYSKNSCNVRTANYIAKRLYYFQNPKSESIIELLTEFDSIWGSKFRDYLAVDGRKEAIDSVMATRHQIAHGGDVGIGVVTIKNHFQRCEACIVHLADYLVV
jgi:RiboL-PSP-HEPN